LSTLGAGHGLPSACEVLERMQQVTPGEETWSAGVALWDGHETHAELLRRADEALYRSKREGRSLVLVAGGTTAAAPDADAGDRGELTLLYQPIVPLGTSDSIQVEALVRWEHPELGRLAPAAFIPAAEDTGAIVPIGTWVLQEVCRQVREKNKEPYTYILLLTAKDTVEDLVEGMEAGADDYLRKPVDSHELRVRVRAGRRILDLQEEVVQGREALRKLASRDPLTWLAFAGSTMMAAAVAATSRNRTLLPRTTIQRYASPMTAARERAPAHTRSAIASSASNSTCDGVALASSTRTRCGSVRASSS